MRRPVLARNQQRSHPRAQLVAAILFASLLVAVVGFDVQVVTSMEQSKNSDFFQFWAAGRAILQGDDPYDPAEWRQLYEQEGRWRWQTDQRVFLYPLWTAFPFAPLALLPISTALLIWTLASEALLVVAIVLATKTQTWTSPTSWLMVLTTAVVFEPVSLTVLFGQIGIVLLCLAAGILYLSNRGRYAWAGVLLSLTLIKPQLFLLVYPVLIVAMILQRRWSFLAAFATTTGALLVSSWLLVPNWIGAWQAQLYRTATVRLTMSPTIWGASSVVAMAFPQARLWPSLGVAAMVAVLGLLILALFARTRVLAEPGALQLALPLSILASLLVAPYVLSYDFVLLLLPISTCLWMAHQYSKPIRDLLVTSVLGCAVILPWALLSVSLMRGQETGSVVVPLSLFAVLLWFAYDRNRRRDPRSLAEQARPDYLDGSEGGAACPL